MTGATELKDARTQTARSIVLAMLIVIMDMSGMSGSMNAELDEDADRLDTHTGINMPGFQSGLVNSSKTLDIYDDGYGACAVLDDSSVWCWGDGGRACSRRR